MNLLLSADAATAGGSGIIMIAYIVIFGVFIYFMMVRPQKKEQKRMSAMLADLSVGDCVLTTSGFYGVVIDISDDAVFRCRNLLLHRLKKQTPSRTVYRD